MSAADTSAPVAKAQITRPVEIIFSDLTLSLFSRAGSEFRIKCQIESAKLQKMRAPKIMLPHRISKQISF